MKTKNIIILSAGLLVTLSAFMPKSSGSHISSTGAPGEETCSATYCHDDASVNEGTDVNTLIFSGDNDVYVPGETYTLTIRTEVADIERFGFQVTGLDNSNRKAGDFVITESTRTQTQNGSIDGSDRQYVTHRIGGTMAATTGINEWTFDWVAPTSDEGIITFYYATQATNNNNANDGEQIFLSTKSISTSVGVNENLNKIDLNAYYNKGQNKVDLKFFSESGKKLDANLYDLKGSLISQTRKQSINKGENKISLGLNNFLVEGIYILEVKIDGQMIKRKLYIK